MCQELNAAPRVESSTLQSRSATIVHRKSSWHTLDKIVTMYSLQSPPHLLHHLLKYARVSYNNVLLLSLGKCELVLAG